MDENKQDNDNQLENDTPEQIKANQSIPEEIEDSLPIPATEQRKLSGLDSAILTLKRINPQTTAYQIGKSLLKHKLSTSRMSVYTRLKSNDYLRSEFNALEKYHREQLVREDLPLARKVVRKHLKNKDKSTPAAVQIQAAKLVYDKALADRQEKMTDSPVNIENIERLQVVIGGALD